MSNWYQAILDTEASPDKAAFLALRVTTRLVGDGVIEPGAALDDTDDRDSAEYVPGPRFAEASGEILRNLGRSGAMEVHLRPWVNDYGIAGLELASCSICGTRFDQNCFDDMEQLKHGFSSAGAQFQSGRDRPIVGCPVCKAELEAQHWRTRPHLGFCHLAFTFWNWPPFEDWTEDVPGRIGGCLGHELVLTYGRL